MGEHGTHCHCGLQNTQGSSGHTHGRVLAAARDKARLALDPRAQEVGHTLQVAGGGLKRGGSQRRRLEGGYA